MTFTPNIPASGQTLGNSRLQVLNNFASLRNTISQGSGAPGPSDQPNHVDVNLSGAGKHIFVQMPVQTPGAANLPAANEGGMITQLVSGSSELFYARDAVNTYYQMTGSVTKATNGATVILGGIRIQWFQASVANGAVIAFPVAFSAPPYCIVGNETAGAGVFDFVKPLTPSATAANFTLSLLRADGNPQAVARTLNFIAIGPV